MNVGTKMKWVSSLFCKVRMAASDLNFTRKETLSQVPNVGNL